MKKTVVLMTVVVLVSASAAFGAGNTIPPQPAYPQGTYQTQPSYQTPPGYAAPPVVYASPPAGYYAPPQWCIMHRLRFIMPLRQ